MRILMPSAFAMTLLLAPAFAAEPTTAGSTAGSTVGSTAGTAAPGAPLTAKTARDAVRAFLDEQGARNLVVGKAKEKDGRYEVDVRTVEGIPRASLVVEPDGTVRRKTRG